VAYVHKQKQIKNKINYLNNQIKNYQKQLNQLLADNNRLLCYGTTLSQNLRKHAAAPKIPNQRHPHTKYQQYPRIKLKMLDPQLKELKQKYDPDGSNPEWINDLTLDQLNCNCPHRIKFEKIFDKDNSAIDAMVWTACKHTTLAAAKRQMKSAPLPAEDVAEHFVQYSKNLIDKEVGEQLQHFQYSVVDWYNHLHTTKQKAIEPVIKYYSGQRYSLSKKELSNIQNKFYTGILKEEVQETNGKPRMVCSVPQSTKYIMGPVTWHLEEIFQDNFKGYCGGKNLTQMSHMINDYLNQGFTKVVEGDGSSFDNTQDVSLKAVDRYIYSRVRQNIYHVPKEDFDEVSQALYKVMDIQYLEGKKKRPILRYKILGTVFSGDCDTTLMNTIRMALYNRYVNDMAGLKYGVDYVCFSKGDDFTVMYKPYVSNTLITRAYYRYFLPPVDDPSRPNTQIYGLGQVLKFLKFGDATTIDFCSLQAWWTDPSETQIYLTRNFNKFLKLSVYSRKTKTYSINELCQYLEDQALALDINYQGIKCLTILTNYYRELITRLRHQYMNIKQPVQHSIKIKLAQQQLKMELTRQQLRPIYNYLEQLEIQNETEVGHRHTQIKQLTRDYWEYMQTIEKTHTETLTQEQAEYVSQQISQGLFMEYIKSIYDVRHKIKV
jgi:phosphoheptose isomerase